MPSQVPRASGSAGETAGLRARGVKGHRRVPAHEADDGPGWMHGLPIPAVLADLGEDGKLRAGSTLKPDF